MNDKHNNTNIPKDPKVQRRIKISLAIIFAIFVIVIGGNIAFQQIKKHMIAKMPEKVNPVTAMKLEYSHWNPTISSTGIIATENGTMLVSQVSSVVKTIHVKDGQTVKHGDLLVELDNDVETANLLASQEQLILAKANYERYNSLYQKKNISESELDKASSSYRSLQANVAAMQAGIERRKIIAPFDGVLGIIRINTGQYLTPGTKVVQIENLEQLKIKFSIPQNKIQQIKLGDTINLIVDAYPEDSFSGQITTIEPIVSATTGLIDMQASIIDKSGKLRSGMFAHINILLAQEQDKIVIPAPAIAYTMYGETAYILTPLEEKQEQENKTTKQKPDEPKLYRAKLIEVKTADRNANLVKIDKGLKVGDMLITSGQHRLNNNSLVNIIDEEPVGIHAPEVIPNL